MSNRARTTGDDSDRSAERAEINHAIAQMHHALSDYRFRRHRVAMTQQDPESDAQIQELYLEAYIAVMHVFQILRPHIKFHLEDEFWSTTEYDDLLVKAPDHEDADEDGMIGGLQLMDHWHDMTDETTTRERRRHEGTVERSVFYANLPHHTVLQRVAALLHEASDRLGFGAQPAKKTPRTEITRELIEGVEEWRQEMLNEINPDNFEEWLEARQNHSQ